MTRNFLQIIEHGWRRITVQMILLSVVWVGSVAMIQSTVASLTKEMDIRLIRVRVAEGLPQVLVRGYDLRISETEPGGKLENKITADKKTEWEMRCQDGKIRLIRLRPAGNPKIWELHAPVIVSTPGGFLNFNDRLYRDELRIYSNGILCEVVNNLDLEKYLDGLVNSEFSAHWNEQSIEAQVVAARTYAYYQIREARAKKGSRFDLDASVKDQVYDGFMKEDYHSSRAVTKTQGWILTVGSEKNGVLNGGSSGVPIKAFYHSMCGGVTELPEAVWGKAAPGFKRKVACPYCQMAPRFRWVLDLPDFEIEEVLRRGIQEQFVQSGKLMDLRIGAAELSGRVSQVITIWEKGSERKQFPVSAVLLRNWLGAGRFRSTVFQIADRSTASQPGMKMWRFEGRGNGHGVGMCQWGAKVMGEKGYQMAEILKFYYPDAVLRKLW